MLQGPCSSSVLNTKVTHAAPLSSQLKGICGPGTPPSPKTENLQEAFPLTPYLSICKTIFCSSAASVAAELRLYSSIMPTTSSLKISFSSTMPLSSGEARKRKKKVSRMNVASSSTTIILEGKAQQHTGASQVQAQSVPTFVIRT